MLDIKIIKTWDLEEVGLYVNNKKIAEGKSFTAERVGYELAKAGFINFGVFLAPPDNIPVGQMPDELTLKNFGTRGEKFLIGH